MFERKSQILQLILTVFLGPLGLIYSSVGWGLLLLLIGGGLFWTVVVPVVCWILAILIGLSKVSTHNANVQELESRFSAGPVINQREQKKEFINNGVIVYMLMLAFVLILWGMGVPGMLATMMGPYF